MLNWVRFGQTAGRSVTLVYIWVGILNSVPLVWSTLEGWQVAASVLIGARHRSVEMQIPSLSLTTHFCKEQERRKTRGRE